MLSGPSRWVGPLRVDPGNVCVWRGAEASQLTPKAFAVLWYLVEHPGRVITKDELFQAVWPGTVVSDGALTVCMSELRKALGDTAQAPQFIETVHRLGYRFIGPITPADASETTVVAPLPPVPIAQPPPVLVGRQAALTQLHTWLAQARSGVRQVVFVTGEPGIGKTTLVHAFLAQVAAGIPLWLAHGQCIEHYGAGEAYLPVLDALGRLCRSPGGERVVEILRQQAPTWLLQMPALVRAAEYEALQRQVVGATRERMLRELGDAVEVLTRHSPCVLVLEDLHWSDYATLELLSWLAQRREPSQLLLIGTYRPVEVIVHGHPLWALAQTLTLRGQSSALPLELLTAAEVAHYLTTRFGESRMIAALAQAVFQQTNGNPLFMVTVVETLVQQGTVREATAGWEVSAEVLATALGVPESLRLMIEQQLTTLSHEDQHVLAAASVVGMEGSAAAIAAGVGATIEAVEERCARLAQRRQFLLAAGDEEWPDGTVTERYRFRHALCHQAVYDRLTSARCRRLHRQIGLWMEAAYGEEAGEHAAELAEHFVRGRDEQRAVRYLRQAGVNALQRVAYAEAIGHLHRGLERLQRLPETPERTRDEIAVQLMLGGALLATKGTAAPEVGVAYTRAQQLCVQLGETLQLFDVLRGLRRFYLGRGDLKTGQALAEQSLSLAERLHRPALLAEAHAALGILALHRGELASARWHLTQGIAYYRTQQPHAPRLPSGLDPGVSCLIHGALVLWFQGYPDQALQQVQQGLSLAHALVHPFTLAAALNFTAIIHGLCGAWQAVPEYAQAAITLATTQGFPLWMAQGTMLQGWALAVQGQVMAGLALMQQGLAGWRTTGQVEGGTFWLTLLAEWYAHDGQIAAGLDAVTEALAVVHSHGLRAGEAELYRLRGQILLSQAARQGETQTSALDVTAEACFRQALEVAHRQEARAWELRAAMSLARLWQQQGKRAEASALLAPVYHRFTEGVDTVDLREARALLEELGA